MPNIGLKGGVVLELGKSSSVAAGVVNAGSRWDARNLLPNGEFLRPDMEKRSRTQFATEEGGKEGRETEKLPEGVQRAKEQSKLAVVAKKKERRDALCDCSGFGSLFPTVHQSVIP